MHRPKISSRLKVSVVLLVSCVISSSASAYYNAGNGRFLSRDRIGYKAGANRYAYVANSPVRHIDPSGNEAIGEVEVFTFQQNYGQSIFSSNMQMRWFPPVKWQEDDASQCPCLEVAQFQILTSTEIWAQKWLGGFPASFSKPWYFDDLDKSLEGDLTTTWRRTGVERRGDGSIGSNQSRASMIDTPGYSDYPSKRLISLNQRFETCAICIDPKSGRYLEVFGCVNWRHTIERDGNPKTKDWQKTIRLGRPYDVVKQEAFDSVDETEGAAPPFGKTLDLTGARRAGAAPTHDFLTLLSAELGGKVKW